MFVLNVVTASTFLSSSHRKQISEYTHVTAPPCYDLFNYNKYDEAYPPYRASCEINEASFFFYALILENEKDKKLNIRLLRLITKRCELGSPYACNNLGNMYGNSNAVAQDYDRTRILYTVACDYGEPVACGNLGYMYIYERGVKQDIALDMKYLELSFSSEYVPACATIGSLF